MGARMFTPENAPEVLAGEQLDAIHEQAMTILEEIGTDVRHEEALELLASHGQRDRRRARALGPRVRDGDGGEGARTVHAAAAATPSGR